MKTVLVQVPSVAKPLILRKGVLYQAFTVLYTDDTSDVEYVEVVEEFASAPAAPVVDAAPDAPVVDAAPAAPVGTVTDTGV